MISKENVEFLIDLQNEILTQETNNPDKPTIWSITENKERAAYPGCGDDYCVKFDEKTYYSSDLQELKEKLKTVHSRSEHTNREIDELVDLEEAYMLITDLCFIGAELIEFEIVDELCSNTGAFLTKRACKEYIHNFGYNHTDPKPYEMVAQNNFELNRLFKIIKETDFKLLRVNKKLDYIKEHIENEIKKYADAPLTDCKIIANIHAAYSSIDALCDCAVTFKEISANDATACRNRFYNRFAVQLDQWQSCN